LKEVLWIDKVQEGQDMNYNWEKAVYLADQEFPLERYIDDRIE